MISAKNLQPDQATGSFVERSGAKANSKRNLAHITDMRQLQRRRAQIKFLDS
jgi:hypothetical protein